MVIFRSLFPSVVGLCQFPATGARYNYDNQDILSTAVVNGDSRTLNVDVLDGSPQDTTSLTLGDKLEITVNDNNAKSPFEMMELSMRAENAKSVTVTLFGTNDNLIGSARVGTHILTLPRLFYLVGVMH